MIVRCIICHLKLFWIIWKLMRKYIDICFCTFCFIKTRIKPWFSAIDAKENINIRSISYLCRRFSSFLLTWYKEIAFYLEERFMGIFDSIKFSEVEINMPLGILRSIPNVQIKMNFISTSSVVKFDLQQLISSILKLQNWKYVCYFSLIVDYKWSDNRRN